MDHKCTNCTNCTNLTKKIELYEKFISDIKEIDKNNINLEDSVIIEYDINGNKNSKVKSDLTESFLVIDEGKNLKELSQRDIKIIKEQDNLSNFNKTKHYIDEANGVYGMMYYLVNFGKWLLL